MYFENGTESNMLKRSIENYYMQTDKAVTENADQTNEDLQRGLATYNSGRLKKQDSFSILKSKSDKKELKEIHNLYKIDFSKDNHWRQSENASQNRHI